jgi:SAM-dependent methyltransferase/DNA-directed RNA polymerase subunit RPC12/RpoP
VHGILESLPPSARVLDLGSGAGSFDSAAYPFRTVRADTEPVPQLSVQADAAALPFPPAAFDAVVASHSLEHFADLDGALAEIGRVVKRAGMLFIAVPHARTFTDRLYRWLARGGAHLNAFTSAEELATRVERATGLHCAGVRVLYTSLSFLNPRNRKARAPRKLLLLGGGREPILVPLTYALRLLDRSVGTRASVYGWALYFGRAPSDRTAWTNVCVRCGAGHPAARLVPGRFGFYRCPHCGARNLFTPDARA